MKTEIIERKGRRFAMVPIKDFEQLTRDAEMLEDIQAFDAAKASKQKTFPSAIADRLVRGESPVRVFREYRGLTQTHLAKAAKIVRPYLSEIETGRKQGSVKVLKALAAALRVELDDLAE